MPQSEQRKIAKTPRSRSFNEDDWKTLNEILETVESFKNEIFALFCIVCQYVISTGTISNTSSSVARGGRGGLEPPHWLVKYAKSHVFGAFEADFL